MTIRFYHEPVLVSEVLAALRVTAGRRYIDATLGGGGHAKEIMARGGVVLGIDTDPEAIEENKTTKLTAVQGNFKNIEEIAKKNGFENVDGILFDLGVSSHQLDSPDRGFSYRFRSAPLDLRLGSDGETALQLLRRVHEDELYEILAKFGEVSRAREFARAIKSSRPVTTGDLLAIVGERLAAQVFQALRIAVNDELESLKIGLAGAKRLLVSGGRLAVISFHSLEDRQVKMFMRGSGWRAVTKKPIVPTEEEIVRNRRARSAKLRVVEKI